MVGMEVPATQDDISGFDLRSLPADFYENPFPYYAALQTHSPVKRLPDGSYFLTRYDEVEFVYRIRKSSVPTRSANSAINSASARRFSNITRRASYSMIRLCTPECAD